MSKIPTIELKKLLDGLLSWVADDYNNHADKTNTWLYRVFYGNSITGFDFYTQAVEIATRKENSLRKVETRIIFDKDRAELPTIFIQMPGEQKGGSNAIGMNVQDDYFEDEVDEKYSLKYQRYFTGNFELMITSGNSFECLLIYELLINLFIAAADSLTSLYQNFDYSGKDLMPNKGLIPYNIFMKSISLNLTYEREVPTIHEEDFGGNSIIANTLLIYDDQGIGGQNL